MNKALGGLSITIIFSGPLIQYIDKAYLSQPFGQSLFQ